MATSFLPTANAFVSSTAPSSSSSSSTCATSVATPPSIYPQKHNAKRPPPFSPILSKRHISLCFISGLVLSLGGKGYSSADASILEADDDEELLERVKRDRKKRIERQGVINSSNKETGYLQDLVYKLSKVGQAIEKNDLSTASSVLGGNADTEWVKKASIAFTKLSSSPEEKTEVERFNSSLASLISSVTQNDVESSKMAFVSSASAFEKWTAFTGLVRQLKGL